MTSELGVIIINLCYFILFFVRLASQDAARQGVRSENSNITNKL